VDFDTYNEIRQYREQQLVHVSRDHLKLNQLHEETLMQVLYLSIKRITDLHGPPPSSFSFFVMGSAGRLEQSVWSDQDHGIIYQVQNNEVKAYFLTLGKEISKGFHEVGYEYCDGSVMASNLLWCKSFSEWEQQLAGWINEASWESIRHLLLFIDGRSVFGEHIYIEQLKAFVYQTVHKEHLLKKVLNNTMYHKKGISVLGKILVETHGPHAGLLNIKEIAILPYVNVVRLLAFKENMTETSTVKRIERIPEKWMTSTSKELYKHSFIKLINYRLLFGNHMDYATGHYLPINQLTKEQKREIKEIIKREAALFQFTKRLIEKEDSFG
jgi:CBS domain-containing protein